MTYKLYEENSHLQVFSATVQTCIPHQDGYAVTLDQTAFFPEGGGQAADTGILGTTHVLDVREENGILTHITDSPLPVGDSVTGTLDWDKRFRRMQNHSGEHIVSGLAHRLYGCDNVGFHMGQDVVTLDLNVFLDESQIREIETRANQCVAENRTVRAFYPDANTLATMNYRSKRDDFDRIRIVEIEGYDQCACCAPHVSRTGEIGQIRLLDGTRYKGGVRIRMLCGFDALDDARLRAANNARISALFSAKEYETADAAEKFVRDTELLRKELTACKKELLQYKVAAIPQTEQNLILFETDPDMNTLRLLATAAVKRCGKICAVFGGKNGTYSYVFASETVDLRPLTKELNAAYNGRGGGSATMTQGSLQAERTALESFFSE